MIAFHEIAHAALSRLHIMDVHNDENLSLSNKMDDDVYALVNSFSLEAYIASKLVMFFFELHLDQPLQAIVRASVGMGATAVFL